MSLTSLPALLFTGQGGTMGLNIRPWCIPFPGMGRSLFAGINHTF
jgi:iron complex outermembrane receptor protein